MEDMREMTLTVLHCDRFHVLGVMAVAGGACVRLHDNGTMEHAGPPRWVLDSPLSVRMRGESVELDSVFGGRVTLHGGDFPVMETTVEPGSRFHDDVLKAYAAIQQRESAKAAGILMPGESN